MLNDDFQKLDNWFEANGMVQQPLATRIYAGRKWTGDFNGREISVTCTRRSQTKYHTYGTRNIKRRTYLGHEFSVEFDSPLQTRLTITPVQTNGIATALDRLLLRRVEMEQITPPQGYSNLKVCVHDKEWSQKFLAERSVKERLTNTLFPAGVKSTTFGIQPGTINFRMRRPLQEITPDEVERILTAVTELAAKAEAMPAPAKTAKRSRLENKLRENPSLAIGGLLAAVIAVAACVPIALLLIIYFNLTNYLLLGVLGFFIWWKFGKSRRKRVEHSLTN